ncbi:periplasmic sensor diguanylate cyclase/phosphodiesterase [Devosia lucknowensis]|uniref:Periplasmic sensor diguanylate cyclase/phosphodiesterase n=1 Tax=Devosia lucknowensis TaxID=1096929 RepID=A0A1Y6GAZ4_9HYPH|nr:EAL domain-containing protein [Devosia lucknowensis]SMQ85587.1 periplasmic sensor diguanylate cyclase/phosphodiesterase [Devosia lucknowensis]
MTEVKTEAHRGDWRRTMVIPVLMAFLVMLVAGIFLDRQNHQIAESRQRTDTLNQISVIRAKLEGNVSSNIQLVKGLVSVISTEPDMDQARYEDLVRNLFEEESQLRSVAAAPDLVIRMTYPLEANAAVVGLDYRTNAAQWPAVEKVVATGRLNIAGPVDLIQGGRGFVGRFPVYIGEGNSRSFWGIVSAVLDLDRLYRDSGLLNPELDLDISITGHDGTGRGGNRFYGPDLSGADPVVADVVLPSGTWQIAAVPRSGWGADPLATWLLRALMVGAGALMVFPILLTGRMVDQRHEHIRALGEREVQLARLSRRLNLALEVSKVGVWEMDFESGDEAWDERTNELYGLPNDGSPRSHDHWRAAVHPDDRERAENDFRRMIATGHYESDYRVVLPDGKLRYVRSIGALFSEPGHPDKVVGCNWDVTSDVELNDNLRRAKRQAEARNNELEAARIRIEHNALHDSLTGLPNRRYLDDVLKRHAADGYHGSGSIALLHIDLDRFKQINDTLGHAAGDAMLIHASNVLRANCRESDFVARIGGDEFIIVSSAGSSDGRLKLVADRIVREMRLPALHEGHEVRFGVSIGVAVSRTADIDVKQLLVNADIALYRAKALGRNRHEFFSEVLQAEVINTKRVADEILKALDTDAFVTYYQPQFCAQTLDLVSVEALVRWQHPEQGIKAPDSFMAVAEELNVVAQIDSAVLTQTLADLARWDKLGLNVPRASVNVSLRRLHDEGLIESLKALDIPAGRLAFELVESIYLDENDGVVAWNIDHIKELGIDVEIDDFGTGYASIVSLQKLHPRRLKIDRQLILPILKEPAQRQLVASIVDIGKSMDIEIVAEGVETMEHAVILRDLGCDILQGYAFAKPMSRDALENFLRQNAWARAG